RVHRDTFPSKLSVSIHCDWAGDVSVPRRIHRRPHPAPWAGGGVSAAPASPTRGYARPRGARVSVPNPAPYYQPRPRSIVGPLILITMGVVALLFTTGVIPRGAFWAWFARSWPIFLIVAGIIKLAEYYWARSKGQTPPRMGGGSIVFL